MTRVEIPHERSRFLAAVGLGTDLAARDFYQSLDDDGRSEVAGLLAETRSRVAKLKEKNAARLAAGEETAD